MRSFKAGLAVVLVLVAGRVGAEEPREVLARAIKAHGGEQLLSKYQAGKTRGKGTVEAGGMSLEFSLEMAFSLPNRIKEVMELEVMGQKVRVVTLFDGTKASMEVNGKELEVSDKTLESIRESVRLVQIARLVSLLKGQDYQLATLPEAKVADKPVVGVKVSAKGKKDVNLYFDKATGLLMKIETRASDPMTGQEFTEERLIAEYQDKDGLKQAKRAMVLRDGKKFMMLEVLESTNLEKLDDKEFSK